MKVRKEGRVEVETFWVLRKYYNVISKFRNDVSQVVEANQRQGGYGKGGIARRGAGLLSVLSLDEFSSED